MDPQDRSEMPSALTRRVTIAMVGGEPTLIFRRVQDLREALAVADDMGLPVTSPRSVADTILGLLYLGRAQNEGEA